MLSIAIVGVVILILMSEANETHLDFGGGDE
jgi:hypothetical protein